MSDTANRARQLARQMGLDPSSVRFRAEGGIPTVINDQPVPVNLYTSQERALISIARDASRMNSETRNEIINISESDKKKTKQIVKDNNLVETVVPTDRDKYDMRWVNDPAPAKLNEPQRTQSVRATFKNQDRRARLEVPRLYLVGPAAGPSIDSTSQSEEKGVLFLNSGIVFPYTPVIEMSHSAKYRKQATVHSNYAQYFYTGSEVSDITLTAKFTVQNSFEAQVLLAVQHLGRALTKMAFGNDQTPIAGSPPPVCRLYAHGEFMLDRTPVVVSSFSMAYPNDVNYFTIEENTGYGITSVPIMTTITMTLTPVYSRNEMLNSSLNGWLTGGQRSQGYL